MLNFTGSTCLQTLRYVSVQNLIKIKFEINVSLPKYTLSRKYIYFRDTIKTQTIDFINENHLSRNIMSRQQTFKIKIDN